MNTPDLISIVILNFNGIEYLKKTIHSYLAQDYTGYEIIVVDNGSSDGSVEYLKQFKNVHLVQNQANLGYNKGKNIGVHNAHGRYILLLDEDIEIPSETFLSSALRYHQTLSSAGERVGFVSPVLVDEGQIKTKYYGIYYSRYGKKINVPFNVEDVLSHEGDVRIGSFHGGAVFFEKESWVDIGGFDNDFAFGLDDYDISARAYVKGYSNFLFKEKLIHLGKSKDENKKRFAQKYSSYYEGLAVMSFKSYKLQNLLVFSLIFLPYVLLLNFLLILNKKNPYLLISPFVGIARFLFGIRKTLIKRNNIQRNRAIHQDIFLKYNAPNFVKV